jgi:hypothetical protein
MKIDTYIQKSLRLILESQEFANQEMVDAILDKVSNYGMESLTPKERKILQNPDEVPEPYDKNKADKEIIDMVFGNDDDDYEVSYEEEQEDQVLMALSELKFKYGVHLKRRRAEGLDNKGNKFPYTQFYDGNGTHIMDLEERIYVKHGGGEEIAGILRVDKALWSSLFNEFTVDDNNKIKVFQKYLGEMYGYDIEEAGPATLK